MGLFGLRRACLVLGVAIGLGAAGAQGVAQEQAPAADANGLQLDGHATLSVGTLSLEEGKDFHLLTSPGRWVTAQLRRAGGGNAGLGGVVLIAYDRPGKSSLEEVKAHLGSGAAMLIAVEDGSTRALETKRDGRTRSSLDGAGTGVTILTVSRATMNQLMAQRDGDAAVLAVHPLQQKTPEP